MILVGVLLWITSIFCKRYFIFRSVPGGTYEYMAPEGLRNQMQNKASDIWSLGILLYELYHKKVPYPGSDCKEVLQSIKNKNKPITFRISMPKLAKELCLKLLNVSANKRPDIHDVLNHPFLKKFFVGKRKKRHYVVAPRKNKSLDQKFFKKNISTSLEDSESDSENLPESHLNRSKTKPDFSRSRAAVDDSAVFEEDSGKKKFKKAFIKMMRIKKPILSKKPSFYIQDEILESFSHLDLEESARRQPQISRVRRKMKKKTRVRGGSTGLNKNFKLKSRFRKRKKK